MRRDEAEELILKYLEEHSIHEIHPKEILDLVEKIGMHPPTRSLFIQPDEFGEGFWYPSNSWGDSHGNKT